MRVVGIESSCGERLDVSLCHDSIRESAVLRVDGVPYHLERIPASVLQAVYSIDMDPDYRPQTTPDGFCYMLVPFSERDGG